MSDQDIFIQLALLLIGLIATTSISYKLSLENFPQKQALKAAIPMTFFFIGISAAFVYLFVML
ncbi:MAG: hypothetical protein ACK4Z6_08225 [Candidatus Methylomirabilales bacterium]